MNSVLIKPVKLFVIICLLLAFISCGTIMKHLAGVPNLNVYSTKEIESNISNLNTSTRITDVKMRDTLSSDTIKRMIYLSIPNTTYLYNSNNKLLCFNGDTDCSIDEIEAIRTENINDQFAYPFSVHLL